jgi:hypothetical protein
MNMWTSLLPQPKPKRNRLHKPSPQTLENKAAVLRLLTKAPGTDKDALSAATGLQNNALKNARSLAFKILVLVPRFCKVCNKKYTFRIRAKKYATLCSPCAKRQAVIDHRGVKK